MNGLAAERRGGPNRQIDESVAMRCNRIAQQPVGRFEAAMTKTSAPAPMNAMEAPQNSKNGVTTSAAATPTRRTSAPVPSS